MRIVLFLNVRCPTKHVGYYSLEHFEFAWSKSQWMFSDSLKMYMYDIIWYKSDINMNKI